MESMTHAITRRGTVTIELAIALLLLLLLTFGMIEYGWLFQKAQHTANAARQGARVGATPDATAGDITAAVNQAMTAGGVVGGDYTITITPANPASLNPGEFLRVEVALNYNNVGLGFPLVPVPGTVTLATTMAKEGP